MLETAKFLLFFTVEHIYQRLVFDITQFIFRENKVIARIDISIVFHYSCMSAFFRIGADAR